VQIIFSVLNQIIPLFQQVEQWFQQMQADGSLPTPREHTTESGHHRIDTRTVWTLSVDSFAASIKQTRGQDCKVLSSWNGLVGYGTKPTKCSSTSAVCRHSPKIAAAIRQHWIENGLHWILDVTFGEDACRVRSPMHPTIWHCYVALPSMRSIRPNQANKPQAEV